MDDKKKWWAGMRRVVPELSSMEEVEGVDGMKKEGWVEAWRRVEYDGRSQKVVNWLEADVVGVDGIIEECGHHLLWIEGCPPYTDLMVVLTAAGTVEFFLVKGKMPARSDGEYIPEHQKEQLLSFIENFGAPWKIVDVMRFERRNGSVIGYQFRLSGEKKGEWMSVRTYKRLVEMAIAHLISE